MNTDPSSENGPVNQAIAVYLEGVASGQPPDQELFLAKYANIRTELESFLNAYGNLNRLEFAATHERNDEHAARQIGDYFLLRNVGQGGMGVVFEATQLSLNRRVAIKLLPFLATLDQRRVDRFRIESMAIASLDHPNIAEVFAVGHDDGLHYFAMRFIDGPTLAELVLRYKDIPSASVASDGDTNKTPKDTLLDSLFTGGAAVYYRHIVKLIIPIAQALQHAHQLGIVHRDIKPGNLMIDSTGKPWLLDFGLAQMSNADTPTMSGDLLGTLRYMSPEQLGADQPVDHRTDIYSLGATLYELLTLTPAFPQENKYDVALKISQAMPTEPTSIDRRIPRDLQTIVLKAMQKSPSQRYETMQEISLDLQRWLDDRPISAVPVSRLGRSWRWCRRNPAATILVSTICLLLIAITSIATISAFRIAKVRDERTQQRDRAIKIVETMTSGDAIEFLSNQPTLSDTQVAMLTGVVDFYKQLTTELDDSPKTQEQLGFTYHSMGEMLELLGRRDESKEAFDRAIAARTQLLSQFPTGSTDNAIAKEQCIKTYIQLAIWHGQSGDVKKAAAHFQAAMKFGDELISGPKVSPDTQELRVGLLLEAANFAIDQGSGDEVERLVNTCLSILEDLKAQQPGSLLRSEKESSARRLLGRAHALRRNWLESSRQYAKSLKLFENVPRPLTINQKDTLAYVHMSSGIIYRKLADYERSEFHHRKSLDLMRELAISYPNVTKFRDSQVQELNNLGILLLTMRRFDEAEPVLAEGIQLLEGIIAERAEMVAQDAVSLVALKGSLGKLHQLAGRYDEAIKWFDIAYETAQEFLTKNPGINILRKYQRNVSWSRAETYDKTGSHKQAATFWKLAKSHDTDKSEDIRILYAVHKAYLTDFEFALNECNEMIESKSTDRDVYYNIAKIYAMYAQTKPTPSDAPDYTESIFEHLNTSIDLSFKDIDKLISEPAFEAYATRDEFIGVVGRLRTLNASNPAVTNRGEGDEG